jgi:hypothetical protein
MSRRSDPWWDREAFPEPHDELWNIVRRLKDRQGQARVSDCNDYLALYFGNDRWGISGYRAGFSGMTPEAPGFNVIQACTDTKVAQIVKNKVRPFFLTEKGDSEAREKAQGMTKGVEGIFREVGLWGSEGVNLAFHGNLFDAGVLKWTPDYVNIRILCDVVPIWEILIPDRELNSRKPRQFFHVTRIDRSVLLQFFADAPKKVKDAILEANPAPHDELLDAEQSDGETVSDLVEVVEAWHLPSGKVDRKDRKVFGIDKKGEFNPKINPGHDGRRAMIIEGVTLLDEPWPYEQAPLVFFRPMPRPVGFLSRGIPETLLGAQMALQRMNKRVDGIMHMHARPLLYVWRQAKVNTAKITNDWATILEGNAPAGQALQHIVPQSVPSEYLARIDKIIEWAKEQIGIPDTAIQANRPAGIEHAPALQFLADVESIRQTPAFQAWEDVFVESAKRVIDLLRLLAERNPDFEIMWGDNKALKRIKWRDVDLEDSKFLIAVWPTNLLPQTPAAKLARVIDMLKNNLLTQERAMLLLDYPDIEAILGDSNALVRNIEEKLTAALKGDSEKAMAHPYLALELARTMGVERINALEADGVPDEKIEPVRMFVEDCDEWIARMAAATPPPMSPDGVPLPSANIVPPEGAPALPPEAPLPV